MRGGKRAVSIFGGFGSKRQHYRYAEEVYKAHGYDVHYYKPTLDAHIINIKRVNSLATQAKNTLLTGQYDAHKNIIHTTSGGFYAGLFLNKMHNNKAIIMEAGPIRPTTQSIITAVEKIGKINLNPLLKENFDTLLHLMGVPTPAKTPEWYDYYHESLMLLPKKALVFTGKNDDVVCHDYVKKIVDLLNAKQVYFENGTHHSIVKTDVLKYQSELESFLKTLDQHQHLEQHQETHSRKQQQATETQLQQKVAKM